MRTSRRVRWALLRVLAAAGLVLIALAGGGVSGPSAEAGTQQFEALASAEGVRHEFVVRNFLIVETLADAGAPVAQAQVDDSGDSRAYAAAPYPGETVLTAPGLANSQAGGALPPEATTYPLIASSSYPTAPKREVGGNGYALTAESTAQSSRGIASSGGRADGAADAGALDASASVTRGGDGRVTAEAVAEAQSVTIAGVLRLGRVVAEASVTREPGGAPQRKASFAVDGATVAGIAVRISARGVTLADETVPLPGNPVSEQLAAAGITVTYLARMDDRDGVVSPGLQVDVAQADTPVGSPTSRYIFGRASAHASAGPVGTGGAGGDIGGGGEPSGPDGAPPGTPATGGAGGPQSPVLPGSDSTPEESDGVIPPPGVDPAGPAAGVRPRAQAARLDGFSFYLPLVIGAAVILAAGHVIRLLGVSRTWISRPS